MNPTYAELRPSALADVVRCVWSFRDDSPARDGVAEPIVPDGSVEVVLNLGDPMEQLSTGGATARQPGVILAGQGTRPTVVRPTGRVEIVGIRLQPWASRAFLDLPAHELRDQIVSPDGDAARSLALLREELADVAPASRLAVAVARLGRLRHLRRPAPRSLARAAVETIRRAGELPSVRELAARLGATERTTQRALAADVGLGPKLLLRITRVQRAIRLARQSPAVRLSSVAARAGYHDQSHFIHDFRALTGRRPSELLPLAGG
ncbi:MAG TPA: helix-turn-helix domain-containing protein, partial [Gemmatimonadaceae bacterium]|nr:helix-turn-helix domain-containing protein [Gemmatimonadaceae bacterium]